MSNLNGTERDYMRRAHRRSAARTLDGSRLTRRCSAETKTKLAAAFIDVVEAHDGKLTEANYDEFRAKASEYGVPLVVIVLLIGIAWDLFMLWLKNRETQ